MADAETEVTGRHAVQVTEVETQCGFQLIQVRTIQGRPDMYRNRLRVNRKFKMAAVKPEVLEETFAFKAGTTL